MIYQNENTNRYSFDEISSCNTHCSDRSIGSGFRSFLIDIQSSSRLSTIAFMMSEANNGIMIYLRPHCRLNQRYMDAWAVLRVYEFKMLCPHPSTSGVEDFPYSKDHFPRKKWLIFHLQLRYLRLEHGNSFIVDLLYRHIMLICGAFAVVILG